MAEKLDKQVEPVVKVAPNVKVLKSCPKCGATKFQGEFKRGEIVNGKFEVKETIYQCLNCNHTAPLDELDDHLVG